MQANAIRRLGVGAIALLLEAAEPLLLVDVREPWEREIAKIDPSILVPLGQLPGALGSLDPTADLVIYCHHGVRSLQACQFLAGNGFTRLTNLEGGIDAWSSMVDPGIARY